MSQINTINLNDVSILGVYLFCIMSQFCEIYNRVYRTELGLMGRQTRKLCRAGVHTSWVPGPVNFFTMVSNI
jgi:hypothetical protein